MRKIHGSKFIVRFMMSMSMLIITIFAIAAINDIAWGSLKTVSAVSTDDTSDVEFSTKLLADTDSADSSTKLSGTVYVNEKTKYKVIFEDDASLLSTDEAEQLIEVMKPITAYGSVAFKSISTNKYSSTSSYASNYYASKFQTGSGTIFLIDMDKRNLWIHSNGKIYSTITTSYANVITDNVYRYASNKDYYTCASKVFEQEASLLAGRRISQPMKYISNALLALVAAILINYLIVRAASRKRKASQNELVRGIFVNNAFNNPQVNFVRQTKVYDPPSSDSSSGGSSSSGGGGGGGGSSSGGGGGHSF